MYLKGVDDCNHTNLSANTVLPVFECLLCRNAICRVHFQQLGQQVKPSVTQHWSRAPKEHCGELAAQLALRKLPLEALGILQLVPTWPRLLRAGVAVAAAAAPPPPVGRQKPGQHELIALTRQAYNAHEFAHEAPLRVRVCALKTRPYVV